VNLTVDVQRAMETGEQPSDEDFKRWASAALQTDQDAELSVRIVDRDESARLNQQYRHKHGPTNVLSFPFDSLPEIEPRLLGDLVICAPVVEQEAQEQQKPPDSHWAHMVIHGTLHLQGYDHINEADADLMESLEINILKELGFANPYTETEHE